MFRLKPFLMTAGLLGSLFGFACGPVSAQVAPAQPAPTALQGPEQRVALVIGNAHYQNAPQLANPDDDAQSMAQFLNSAGFEVVAATDLTQNDMIRVVQDFSARIASRGPNTVAMVYYAGHGVQLAGENYLVPVDAKVSNPTELVNNSVRLVDVMSTLETIPSRMRIVILDACRNNPFLKSTMPAAALPSSMRRTARSSVTRPHRAPRRSTAPMVTVPIPRPS